MRKNQQTNIKSNKMEAWLIEPYYKDPEPEYIHKCDGCDHKFQEYGGVKMGDEKFCDHCLKRGIHYLFYVRCGATMNNILQMEIKQKRI